MSIISLRKTEDGYTCAVEWEWKYDRRGKIE